MGDGGSKCLHRAHIQTGDQKGASTDANAKMILYNSSGDSSETIDLGNTGKNDFQTGALDTFKFKLPGTFGEVTKIELWCEKSFIEFVSSSWFVDKIELEYPKHGDTVVFPVFRWIKLNVHYKLYPWGTFLPQFDPDKEQREEELKDKRQQYIPHYKEGYPVLTEKLPVDEEFSDDYKWHMRTNKLDIIWKSIYSKIVTGTWKNLTDLTNVYYEEKLTVPKSADHWREDTWFGNQRLIGCNPTLITLCTEIPSKLGVDEDLMKPVLKEESLAKLIEQKHLFYTDLEILEGLDHKEGLDICAPIALFMLTEDNESLLPIAIQLQQNKGPDNPVFLPTDQSEVWTLAKLWYNHSDASYHQSLVHLGWTHMLMEGVVIALHRNISVCHPVFKLLAPHTLFLLAINSRGLQRLVSEGGWVDKTMTIGVKGMFQLISKGLGSWRFDVNGVPPKEFQQRKVYDLDVLPNYYYRNDSLLLYECIKQYVSSYVELYYNTAEKVTGDWEIQNWAEMLARNAADGGIGLKGVPLKDGQGYIGSREDLIMMLTAIIYQCSVSHAHANFLQYEDYGFPANYPSLLRTPLLKNKDPKTEEDILDALPDKATTLNIMAITQILSEKTTNFLGDFETHYIFDPDAVKIFEQFRMDLKKVGDTIRERNKTAKMPYEVLEPCNIPNAISI